MAGPRSHVAIPEVISLSSLDYDGMSARRVVNRALCLVPRFTYHRYTYINKKDIKDLLFDGRLTLIDNLNLDL